MFRIIKVIYTHCGKFTMSIKLQRAGKEQVTNQHERFESTCMKCFYIFIKRGRDRQEQREGERVRSVLEKMSTDVLAVALPCVAAFHVIFFFYSLLCFPLMLLEFA